jgi:hypothetical protein
LTNPDLATQFNGFFNSLTLLKNWFTFSFSYTEWFSGIKKSLIIAVSHPAESGGGSEAEAHCRAEEESDPGGQRPRGTLPGTYRDFSFIFAEIEKLSEH